jgi:hypothetical protein
MIDTEFLKFYKDVKGSEWPEIASYTDFLKLPDWIKQECYHEHDLRSRLDQICDRNHWKKTTIYVLGHKNIAYVPVTKCASTYYCNLFSNSGWKFYQLDNLDQSTTKLFGFVMHPMKRHLKGITEFLVRSYTDKLIDQTNLDKNPEVPWVVNSGPTDYATLLKDLDTIYMQNLVGRIGVGDEHSLPYSAQFGDLLYKINWIPVDILDSHDQKTAIENFFKANQITTFLQKNTKNHASSDLQLKVFDKVCSIVKNSGYYPQLHQIFDEDLRFYYNLVDTFDINFNTIK